MNFQNTKIILTRCCLCPALTLTDADCLSLAFAQSEPWRTLGIAADSLKSYLLREDAHLQRYVLRVEGETAGVLCVRYPWLRGPYVELFGLLPAFRQQGIGTDVLSWLEQEAKQQHKNIWLLASCFNQPALQFYHRYGFETVARIDGLVHSDYDEFLLRKRL